MSGMKTPGVSTPGISMAELEAAERAIQARIDAQPAQRELAEAERAMWAAMNPRERTKYAEAWLRNVAANAPAGTLP